VSSGSLGPPGSEMGVVIVLCELLGSFREKQFAAGWVGVGSCLMLGSVRPLCQHD